MPENKVQQPRNILEVINFNIVAISEDMHRMMDDVIAMRREVAELRKMFNAPEQPNALGEEGVDE